MSTSTNSVSWFRTVSHLSLTWSKYQGNVMNKVFNHAKFTLTQRRPLAADLLTYQFTYFHKQWRIISFESDPNAFKTWKCIYFTFDILEPEEHSTNASCACISGKNPLGVIVTPIPNLTTWAEKNCRGVAFWNINLICWLTWSWDLIIDWNLGIRQGFNSFLSPELKFFQIELPFF